MRAKKSWLSAYIYYDSSREELLLNDILSLGQTALKKKYASQFFFIRYFDRQGLHIRLRFKGDKKIMQNKLKPYLISKLCTYSIKFVRYLPEYRRYGGPVGMEIAQQQFEASSKIILQLLSENKNFSYERALGTALQLHLGMVCAMKMKKKEAVELFDHIAHHPLKDVAEEKKFNLFEEKLEKQKNILPYLASLWTACENGQQFKDSWMNTWLTDMEDISNKLNKAQYNHQLQVPKKQLWHLFESYIHMTNNRLGIANHDEPFLAYILQHALEINHE